MNCPVWICDPVTTTSLPTTSLPTTSTTTTSDSESTTFLPLTTTEPIPNSNVAFDLSIAFNVVFCLALFLFLAILGYFLIRKKIQRNDNTQTVDAESVQTPSSVSNANQHFSLDSDNDDMEDVPLHAGNDTPSSSTNPQPEYFFMKCFKRT